MAELYQEYLRRNLLVAKAIGAKANASAALKRLEMQSHPPQWLVNALRGILERVDPLPADLAKWRDTAPDVPDYVRAEMETAVDCPKCGYKLPSIAHFEHCGHGHVVKRHDGMLTRCGGPLMCNVCAAEKAAINQP